jgi:hypothetical protein
MRYEAILYFNGPLSNFPKWRGVPDEREVIARKPFRFRLFALGWARGRLKGMQNCGLVILEK